MTNQRASATDDTCSETPQPKTSMYQTRGTANTFDKILQIQSLARVSACATDTLLNIDLSQTGYLGVFEIINQLCEEVYLEIEELQHVTQTGIYAPSTTK